jgi:hypothetical protein
LRSHTADKTARLSLAASFDRLADAYGRDAVFRDIDNIPAGTDFREHINGVLSKCDLLIVVIGRRWLGRSRGNPAGRINDESDLVRVETETALQLNVPIIPVLVGNAQMPGPGELPETLKPLAFRNALRVDPGQDFDNHLSRLLRSINGYLELTANVSKRKQKAQVPHKWFAFLGVLLFAGLSMAALLTYFQRERSSESNGLGKRRTMLA